MGSGLDKCRSALLLSIVDSCRIISTASESVLLFGLEYCKRKMQYNVL